MVKVERAYGWEASCGQMFIYIDPLANQVSVCKINDSFKDSEDDISAYKTRKGFTNLVTIDHSPVVPGLVAAGQYDGTVKVFDILTQQSGAFEIKRNKRVTDLSFNNQGLLAVGLGKGYKSEGNLQIFNINHYSSKNSNQELQQATYTFIPNEPVVSSIFHSEFNILAGCPKSVREIDIRVPTPAFQVSSRATCGIQQDPYNPFNFASYSEDGTLNIYDRRKLSRNSPDPVLSFEKLMGDSTRKNNPSVFRYSPTRRNEFAISIAGSTIRRWQIGCIPSNEYDKLFVASVSDVKTKYGHVISFDYASATDCRSNSTSFVCLRQSGTISRIPVIETQRALHFNSSNDLVFTGSSGIQIESVDDNIADGLKDLRLQTKSSGNRINDFNQLNSDIQNDDDSSSMNDDLLGVGNREGEIEEEFDEDEAPRLSDFTTPKQTLENDISVKMKKRAMLGYGTDCAKNMEIIEQLNTTHENVIFLRSTWRWLEIVRAQSNQGSMSSQNLELDLSYEGVLGIWKGVEGLQSQDRFGNLKLEQQSFEQKIEEILSARKSKAFFDMVETAKPAQRTFGLMLVGFYFDAQEFDDHINRMVSTKQFGKAAAWAVYMGDVTRAVNILSSSSSSRLKLIAAAISGYLVQQHSSEDNIWKTQCKAMAQELDDIYLKAIFSYIAESNWWDVLDEIALPLREKIGIALRCLNDSELTSFLNKVSERTIARGGIEGIILTGITPRGMDLLQSYVDNTADVQTAALISCFACPKYFKDNRAEHWVHCYRQLLNSWRMFKTKANFDISRAELSYSSSGKLTLKSPASQIQLQCPRCNKNTKSAATNVKARGVRSGHKASANVSKCSSCQAPLPKCAICLLALGKPLPKDISENQKQGALTSMERDYNDFKEWPSFCLTCNHGMHTGHAEEWFSKSTVCPVPGCLCRCNNR